MALQVWLPLNGNLNNQGIDNTTVTNNGAIVDNNGKIGKCYNFDGTYISFNRPLPNPCSAFTVCGWVKLSTGYTANNGLHLISFETSYGRICISKDGQAVRVLLNYNGTTSATGSTATASSISANVWNHYAVTFDSGKINIYINGQLDNSYTVNISQVSITSSILKVGTYGTELSKGCVNDFRLYDRALAPKEIEILSRGLVCHYPLNNNGGGQPNLYDFESVASKWAVDGLTLANATDDVYGNVLKITSPSSVTSQRIYRSVSNVWKADTKFTVSFLAKASKTAVVKMSRSLANYAPDVTVGTTWKRYSTVITCSTTTEGGTLSIQTSTASADIYLTQIKLELGDKATAYCPGVGDSHYIPLGYDSTTEYDVSGYGYNGTKNGTIAYSNDTARYSVFTTFNGSNTYIEADPLPSETATIACWLKTPWAYVSGAYQLVIHDKNTGLAIGWSGSNMITYVGSGNGGTGSYLNTSGIWQANKWMHVVVVKTGSTTRDIYINGVKQSPSGVNYWGGDLNKLNIGNRHISGSYSAYFNGQISDFRAYVTPLTEAQIKELYNTAVSVANNGTLMGYEFVEV